MVKNLPASAGDTGLTPEAGRSPGGGNGNSLQHSCLGNGYSPWNLKEVDMTQHPHRHAGLFLTTKAKS